MIKGPNPQGPPSRPHRNMDSPTTRPTATPRNHCSALQVSENMSPCASGPLGGSVTSQGSLVLEEAVGGFPLLKVRLRAVAESCPVCGPQQHTHCKPPLSFLSAMPLQHPGTPTSLSCWLDPSLAGLCLPWGAAPQPPTAPQPFSALLPTQGGLRLGPVCRRLPTRDPLCPSPPSAEPPLCRFVRCLPIA